MEFVNSNSEIFGAIISGVVALFISGVVGIFTLFKTRKRLEEFRVEIKTKSFSEHAATKFLAEHSEFSENFKIYDLELRNRMDDADGTKRIQVIIDFYAEFSRGLIERYPDYLGKDIVDAGERMQKAVDELSQNFVPNDQSKLHYAAELQDAGFEVNKMISKFNPR